MPSLSLLTFISWKKGHFNSKRIERVDLGIQAHPLGFPRVVKASTAAGAHRLMTLGCQAGV